MTPAVKAFVEVLIDRFEQRIAELEGRNRSQVWQ